MAKRTIRLAIPYEIITRKIIVKKIVFGGTICNFVIRGKVS
jgi:hypothetical protein